MSKLLWILFCILLSNFYTTHGQPCSNYVFSRNQIFTTCVSLPVLNSHLHWNYHANGTVDVAFRHTGSTTNQWVAWALNVDGSGMIGSQALVAVVSSTGSVQGYTSQVTSYGTGLQSGSLSFDVSRISTERVNEVVVIYATLVLPRGGTTFNQVWQVGPVINGAPSIHQMNSDNRNAVGSIDFSTGLTADSGGVGGSRQRRRNVSILENFRCLFFYIR